MEDDIEGIFKTISDIGFISKWAGGIGVDLSSIRARGSLIRGTNGLSDGIIPLCTVLNRVGKYINQGGKRNGSIACYLQLFHADIWQFVELRKNTKDEDSKARDLFLALFVPDLFWKRVEEDGVWSLMCPDECPGLVTSYGEQFERLYIKYEKEKRYKKQVKAIDLLFHIMDCQMETGIPYMTNKDHINNKSNQKNIGPIRSSNLCAEITEVTDRESIAVCNLASICLPSFIEEKDGKMTYNFEALKEISRVVTRNLNKIIDINYYPTPETKYTNLKHRPIGIGVQGLVDVYMRMGYAFSSPEAFKLNKQIFETIYYGSLYESCEIAKREGAYETFKGSPFSEGKLQYHLWGLTEKDLMMNWDWKSLIEDIKVYGTRNSLLTALMPTATTSQIMNNFESFEPTMSNIFIRSTLAGEFIVVNEHLVRDLIKRDLWSSDMRKLLIIKNGTIQDIKVIPEELREIYKTAFEIKQKDIIKQAAERGPFVDQSQSMNLFLAESNFEKLMSAHYDAWKMGLKTGMYYLRTRPSVDPIQFGIDIEEVNKLTNAFGLKPDDDDMPSLSQTRTTEVKTKENKSSENQEEEKPRMCRFRPGQKIEGCDVCSA